MGNQISSIKKIQKEIDLLIGQMKALGVEVLSVSKSTREAATSFKGIKTPEGASKALKKTSDEAEKLVKLVEKQRLAEINLQKAREKAFDIHDKQLNKEKIAREKAVQDRSRFSQLLLSQKKKEEAAREKGIRQASKEAESINKAAALSKKLGQALSVAARKRNELAQTIQNLNVKRELGNKLSDKEQIELKQSVIAFKRYDNAVRKAKESVGRFQENVGNYPKGMRAAAGAARNLAGAMGLVGGAFLAVSVVRDAFKRIREFDKTMQNLSGVLRASRKDIKDLEGEIISVAKSSVRTTTEVASLAESLITLGKSKDEVKKLLAPVTDLSLGLNVAADEAGEFLVQMLNTFGASTDQAKEYADTIATIRTSTSLDFQKMRDSFQYLAPISKALNKDLAFTGALIGILADNGIRAERAGRLLGTAQQKLAAEGKSLSDALEEVNAATESGASELDLLALSSKLFGKQASALGLILANNSEIIDTNAQAIRDNGGALDDLVKEQLNSLDSKIKLLESSWEGLITTVDNGTGSLSRYIKGSLGLFTSLLNRLSDIEEASSKLSNLGVEKSITDRLSLIIAPLKLIKTDFEKAQEAQEDFIKVNKSLSSSNIELVVSIRERLKASVVAGDLSEKEKKVYIEQIKVLQESIELKKEERKQLVETAKQLGFSGEAYDSQGKFISKFYKNAEQASSRELKLFIAANEAKISSNAKLKKDDGGGKGKRSEAVSLSKLLTKTSNELAETEIRNAFKVTQAQIEQYATVNGLKQKSGESDTDFSKRVEDEIRATRGVTEEYIAQFIALKQLRQLAAEPFDENGGVLNTDKLEEEAAKIKKVLDLVDKWAAEARFDEILRDSIGRLGDTLEGFTGISGDKFLSLFDKIKEGGIDSFEEIADIAQASFALIGDASNSFFQSKIDGYQADIDSNNEYYDNLLENENLSDDEKDRLEKDRKAKNKEIEKEKQKAQIKQAVANKAFGVADIILSTAKGIASAASNPITLPLIPLIAGIGAAELALALATPIPKFAEGGVMGEDGAMMINDHKSGRLEVVERDGKFLMTDKKNAIVQGQKGDIIHKDAQAHFDGLSDSEIINNAKEHSLIATLNHQNYISNKLTNKLTNDNNRVQTDRIVKAISKQKTKFNVQNNVSLGDDYQYLNMLNEF